MVRFSRIEILMTLAAAVGVGVVVLIAVVWGMESSRMRVARVEVAEVRAAAPQAVVAKSEAQMAAKQPPAETPAPAPAAEGPVADIAAAQQLFKAKACTGCHIAPGIPEAVGTVGPDLTGLASRPQIAGVMDMSGENLAKWIRNPPAEKPGTAMPPLGLSDADVQTLVNWLLTLN